MAPSEPSSASADDDLRTRTELKSSEAKALKSKARERLGLAPASLLAPVDSASMLLIRTSAEVAAQAADADRAAFAVVAVDRDAGQALQDSGQVRTWKSAMSSALMASSMTSEVLLVSIALRRAAR